MSAKVKFGLISGTIGLVLNVFFGSLSLGIAILAGAAAGFFTARAEPAPKGNGASGAISGVIAGLLVMVGHIVGAILNHYTEAAYYAGVACVPGLFYVALCALVGAIVGNLANPAQGQKIPQVTDAQIIKGNHPRLKDSELDRLIKNLKDSNGEVRINAVKALGEAHDPRAVKHLSNMLTDKYAPTQQWGEDLFDGSSVGEEAVKALGRIGDEQAVTPLITTLETINHNFPETVFVDALVQIGKPAVKPLIKLLKSGSKTAKLSAVAALVKINDEEATESLISALTPMLSEPEEQIFAAVQLRELGPNGIDPLIKAFIADNFNVKSSVVNYGLMNNSVLNTNVTERLRKFSDDRMVESLIKQLADKNGVNVAGDAAKFLGALGDKQTVVPLIAALEAALGKDTYTCSCVIAALQQIGDPRAIPVLIEAFKFVPDYLNFSIARALGSLGASSVEPLLETLETSTNNKIRPNIISVLGDIGDARAMDGLIACLNDNDKKVRTEAIRALGKIGAPGAVMPLIAVLQDSDYNVRQLAVEALGQINDVRSEEPLRALKDSDPAPHVRKAAETALSKLVGNEDEIEISINTVYMLVTTTVFVSPESCNQFFPFALQQLNQTDKNFEKLYQQVDRKSIPVVRGNAVVSSLEASVLAFEGWLKSSYNVVISDMSSTEKKKRVFPFAGDAQNPVDGNKFKWCVFVYYK